VSEPIICFGQQPNGVLPKNFFMAKLSAARKLQQEIGGKIIWFCHDSDHDPKETRTRIPVAQHPDGFVEVNFSFVNKTQRKFTPLAHKNVGDLALMRETLRHHTNECVLQAFDAVTATTVSEFCIQMYQNLGLLDGIQIVRSSDKAFRMQAAVHGSETGWFYDVEHDAEIVRARLDHGRLSLHRGGDVYDDIGELTHPEKEFLSPGWQKRFDWMQSVIQATHYITGASEQEYLKGVTITRPAVMVAREDVTDPDLAFIP